VILQIPILNQSNPEHPLAGGRGSSSSRLLPAANPKSLHPKNRLQERNTIHHQKSQVSIVIKMIKGTHISSQQSCNYYDVFATLRRNSKRGGAHVSYKEASDDGTESEDLVEVDWSTYEPPEPDNAETIEKIIAQRIGKKGGNQLFP